MRGFDLRSRPDDARVDAGEARRQERGSHVLREHFISHRRLIQVQGVLGPRQDRVDRSLQHREEVRGRREVDLAELHEGTHTRVRVNLR